MSMYDEELQRLHRETERKRQLEVMTADLRAQKGQLTEKTAELERSKLAEQADVDRLEGQFRALDDKIAGLNELETLTPEQEQQACPPELPAKKTLFKARQCA